ncbi:MAG TPA: hypothetical protein VGP07_08840 [Polyangia bacterium]|jgi:hypothetical protein
MRRPAPLLLVLVFTALPGFVHAEGVPDGKTAEAASAPAATTPEGTPVPVVKRSTPVPSSAAPPLPFRLGLFYAHAFGQSGNLTRFITPNDGNGAALPSPAALGIDLGIGLGSYVRYHFGVGTEWEGETGYAARGFRFDPVTLGFPILVWSNSDVAIHVEPLLHLVRGEILFQSKPMVSDSSLFRIESGIAGAVTVVTHHWFVSVEPLSVDFRVFEANNKWVHTGFSHLWWFQLTAGHEF